jgi:ATP-dependent exoDNAse (exonuclease V) beta subunit
MVEAGEDRALAQAPAIAAQWGVDPAFHDTLLDALRRWRGSAVRREALAWPCVRAEVPFVCAGDPELAPDVEFAEGAIDLLCTDPARADEALVIDYKTGGAVGEDQTTLRERHALQARVYAHALGQAGYTKVTLRFVRVQIPDHENPNEPEVVTYVYENGTAVQ